MPKTAAFISFATASTVTQRESQREIQLQLQLYI
jgi:hypothetical protein